MNTLPLRIFKASVMLICICVASPAFSATANVPQNRTITTILVYPTYAVINYTPAFSNSLCASSYTTSAAVLDWSTDTDFKSVLPALLAAKLLGKQVGFGISSVCHPALGGVPRIYRVDLP